ERPLGNWLGSMSPSVPRQCPTKIRKTSRLAAVAVGRLFAQQSSFSIQSRESRFAYSGANAGNSFGEMPRRDRKSKAAQLGSLRHGPLAPKAIGQAQARSNTVCCERRVYDEAYSTVY